MPLLGDVHQRQVEQLDRSVFIGEGAAGLDHLAQSHVQGLYRVGGVNDFSNIGREREEGHDQLQVPAPELADRAVLDRKSTRLNSSHLGISHAVFCLKKKSTSPPYRNPTYCNVWLGGPSIGTRGS